MRVVIEFSFIKPLGALQLDLVEYNWANPARTRGYPIKTSHREIFVAEDTLNRLLTPLGSPGRFACKPLTLRLE
jgi:hypothetical protein